MAIIQDVVMVVTVGEQGPMGPRGLTGSGQLEFDTKVAMFATTGIAGQIAHCADEPDWHWKWNTAQGTWVFAF